MQFFFNRTNIKIIRFEEDNTLIRQFNSRCATVTQRLSEANPKIYAQKKSPAVKPQAIQ